MSHLVWIDLEMTGLDIKRDKIIEIATVITDTELNIVATGPNLVIHQPSAALTNLDPWVEKTHSESGLLERVRNSELTTQDAMLSTLAFIKQHVAPQQSPLCGNSIGTDRAFLQEHMPDIADYVHYRNLDVSSIKLLQNYWYTNTKVFTKANNHRALDDILGSIAELKHYREHLFTQA